MEKKQKGQSSGPQKKGKANYSIKQGIVKEIFVVSPLEEKAKIKTGDVKKTPKKPFQTTEPNAPLKEVDFDRIPSQKEPRKKESSLTLLVIPSEEYTKNIYYVANYLSKKYSKVLYVSLNELYSNLVQNFLSRKINPDRFYFIDTVTSTADSSIEKNPHCTFVVSQNALVELSLAISNAIETKNTEVVFFDSLSTLLIYENPKTVVKFIHSLIGKIKAARLDAFFTALEGDIQSQAIKDLGMFVDDFISIDKFKMYRVELGFESPKKAFEKRKNGL